MGHLTNKTALLTGAGRGIGAAIARAFMRDGVFVHLADTGQDAGRARAAELCGEHGDRAGAFRLDVSSEADWAAAEDRLGEAGGLNILVNNAGITGFLETAGPHDPENLDLASRRPVTAANADGVALGCRTGIRLMKGKGGAIVNLSSRSGVVGIPAAAAYAASKAAMMNHTRTVALYCARAGYAIRGNALLPAAVMTPMWDAMLGDGDHRGCTGRHAHGPVRNAGGGRRRRSVPGLGPLQLDDRNPGRHPGGRASQPEKGGVRAVRASSPGSSPAVHCVKKLLRMRKVECGVSALRQPHGLIARGEPRT